MLRRPPPPPATAFLALTVLWLIWPEPLVHPDTTRDWLMARDCAELQQCATRGATTSFAGLRQGAIWPDLLAAAWHFGLSPTALHVTLLALHASAAAAARAVTGQWAAFALALLGTVLAAPQTAVSVAQRFSSDLKLNLQRVGLRTFGATTCF